MEGGWNKIIKEKLLAIALTLAAGLAVVFCCQFISQKVEVPICALILFTLIGLGALLLPPAKKRYFLLLPAVFITAFFINGLGVVIPSLLLSYLIWGLALKVSPRDLIISITSILVPLISGGISYLKLGGSLPVAKITLPTALNIAFFFFLPYLGAWFTLYLVKKRLIEKGDRLKSIFTTELAKGIHLHAFSLFLAFFGAVIYYKIGLAGFILAMFILISFQGDTKQLVSTGKKLEQAIKELSIIFSASTKIHLHLEEEGLIRSIFQATSSFLPLFGIELGISQPSRSFRSIFFDGKSIVRKEGKLTLEEKEGFTSEGTTLKNEKGMIFAPLIRGKGEGKFIRFYPISKPDERSLRILNTLLPQIANAVENAHLHYDLKQEKEKYRELSENLEKKIVEKTEALVKSEEELRKRNLELENFANILSHDLKSPLVSIGGFFEVFHDKYGNFLDQKGRHYLERMKSNIDYMNFLVRELFELSRRGKSSSPFKKEDAIPIVYEALTRFQFQLEEKGIDVMVTGVLPVISCDRYRMIELFTNLIENAIKYSDPEKEKSIIEIGVKEEEDSYQFYVKDNGSGIPQDKLKRLFNKEKGEKGMGLLIVKEIVESHRGRIKAESTPGEGTTFYITLPKAGVK